MSDYIKRENALNAFNNYFYAGLTAKINEIPSEDVEPVRHGRWIYKDEPIFGNPYGRYCCDLCEYGVAYEEKYCPDCGARMDGVKDNGTNY